MLLDFSGSTDPFGVGLNVADFMHSPTSSQHRFEVGEGLLTLLVEGLDFGDDFHRWGVLHLLIHHFLVSVDAEVPVVGLDFSRRAP